MIRDKNADKYLSTRMGGSTKGVSEPTNVRTTNTDYAHVRAIFEARPARKVPTSSLPKMHACQTNMSHYYIEDINIATCHKNTWFPVAWDNSISPCCAPSRRMSTTYTPAVPHTCNGPALPAGRPLTPSSIFATALCISATPVRNNSTPPAPQKPASLGE